MAMALYLSKSAYARRITRGQAVKCAWMGITWIMMQNAKNAHATERESLFF